MKTGKLALGLAMIIGFGVQVVAQAARPDAYEPDNRASAAKRIYSGRTQNRSIHIVGNVDWIKFKLTSPRKVVLTTGRRSGYRGGDTEMWLFGPNTDKRPVAGGYNNNYGGTKWSRITIHSLRAGTYYLKVREKGNNGRIEGYTLKAVFSAVPVIAATESYLVIDLSGGPSASSYSVSNLNAVPVGGWSDEYKTTKLVLRRIPAGTYTMGSPTDELGRDSDETQHSVTLTKDFYIGVFEVTQKQWERVMGTWPSYFYNATYRDSRPVEEVSYYDIRENPANSNDSAVDWPNNSTVNARSFMGKLRAKTGLATFDLPTEAQWEQACRAGTATALNSGKNLTETYQCPNMAEVGRYWFNGGSGYNENGDDSLGNAKVGSYLPNAWGLYDMHGNVSEWCLDWYGTYPGAVSDPSGAASGSDRVARGASWYSFAMSCRSAYRHCYNPGSRHYGIGFRISMTLP